MKIILAFALAIIFVGCSSTNKQIPTLEVQPLSPALSQPCEKLTTLNGTDGKAVTSWFVKNIPTHNRCARNNDAVISSYNHLYNTVKEYNEVLSDPKKLKEFIKANEAKNK